MRTEIITERNQHFDWIINQNGQPEKRILSDKIIEKQIIVTYDDDGNEIARDNYNPKVNASAALIALHNSTPEEIEQIKQILGINN
jgi:hypothetical protein